MTATHPEQKKILIVGGTGAQGRQVATQLARDGKYLVTILTRDVDSPVARSLGAIKNVVLLAGHNQSEKGLREALKGQYGVFVNFDSFSMTESAEYFWTFRLYDIAVQSGVQHLVYSGVPNRPKEHHYEEHYRSYHQLMKGRIQEWIAVQPTSTISWTIIIGNFYTEMLSSMFRPSISPDGTYVFASPITGGYFPFIEIAQYGHYARWIFDNPSRSVGKIITIDAYHHTMNDVAEAFTKVTGKKSAVVDLTNDEWFELEVAKEAFPPGVKAPKNIPGGQDDDTRFDWQKSFRAFWNLYRTLNIEEDKARPGLELADEIYPDRNKSVEEWMRSTGYTGEAKAELKMEMDNNSNRLHARKI